VGEPSLYGAHSSGRISEQLAAIVDPEELKRAASTRAAAARILWERGDVPAEQILGFGAKLTYYPAPDLVNERVVSQSVQTQPDLRQHSIEKDYSGLSTSGVVQFVEALSILRAWQVGSLPNTRLVLPLYQLLHDLGESAGPWLGPKVHLNTQRFSGFNPSPLEKLLPLERRRVFQPLEDGQASFLDIRTRHFAELDSQGNEIHGVDLQYIAPHPLSGYSMHQIAMAPLMKVRDPAGREQIYIGFEDWDLPVCQLHEGSSAILSVPLLRLTEEIKDAAAAFKWGQHRLQDDYGISALNMWGLPDYNPSNGICPGRILPCLVGVDVASAAASRLNWIRLEDIIRPEFTSRLRHGPSLLLSYCASHALGKL